jgi:hypothetical protein
MFLNTQILKTLDLKNPGQARDASAALLALEQATDQYHALGTVSEVTPSTIPEGATLAALLKLLICDASSSFNFFLTALPLAKLALISGHATGIMSTFPLIFHQAVARLDVAGDKERVETLNWIILIANLIIGTLEAIIQMDLQRALALGGQAYFVCSHGASTIEAYRTVTNQNSTALLDRRKQEATPLNSYIQPALYDAQKQTVAYNALLGKPQPPPPVDHRFFLVGGSDGNSFPSATPAAYLPLPTIPSSEQPQTMSTAFTTPMLLNPAPPRGPNQPTATATVQSTPVSNDQAKTTMVTKGANKGGSNAGHGYQRNKRYNQDSKDKRDGRDNRDNKDNRDRDNRDSRDNNGDRNKDASGNKPQGDGRRK